LVKGKGEYEYDKPFRNSTKVMRHTSNI
jgi:hypothetical protein